MFDNVTHELTEMLKSDVSFAYFHCMLFLDFFSINPMPSNTLVMSYILLFCLTAN